jgi:hypothetical protein
MAGVQFPAGKEIIFFSTASKSALGSIPHPVAWILGSQSSQGMMLTIHLNLASRPRMVQLYLHSPHISSWYAV